MTSRDQFEKAFISNQVEQFGENYRSSAEYLLDRNKDYGISAYDRRRKELGQYEAHWVETTWWAWQESRATVVVKLPPPYPMPEEPEFADDDSYMDAYHAAKGMRHACGKAIEAAGLKVAP